MDTIRELESTDPIFRARLEHERLIGWFALALCALGIIVASWRMATVEWFAGRWLFLVIGVATVVYATSLVDRNRSATWKCWARASFEASIPSVILLVDRVAGPEFLITSSTPYLYLLVVVVCCLRLRPFLSMYVAALSIAQQAVIYLIVIGEIHSTIPIARLHQELFFRLAILALGGLIGTMLARSLKKEIRGAADEARVRSAFGSYVDHRVVERVLGGDLAVAPERREVTVMFVDIRGFTQLSENRDPADVFQMLAGALDAFSVEVQRQGGIVNKFLGDGLLAIFGAPEPQEDHSRRAVRAALLIANAARERASDGRFPGLAIGIGIHTGEAVLGVLGGVRREYTAIGDVVNVASRVEAANKELRTTILVTEAVRLRIGDGVEIRPMKALPLRGRTGPIRLFEVTVGATVA